MESMESVECGAAPGAGSADPSGIPGWMRLRVHGNGRGKSRERTGPAREIPGIRSFPAFPGGILPSGKDFGIKKNSRNPQKIPGGIRDSPPRRLRVPKGSASPGPGIPREFSGAPFPLPNPPGSRLFPPLLPGIPGIF